MYLERHEFKKAYARIRDASIIGGCTVLILAAPDCDAICAARILTVRAAEAAGQLGLDRLRGADNSMCTSSLFALQHLLRSDSIEYKLVAVAGFTDVQKEIQAAAAVTAGGVSPVRAAVTDPRPCHRSQPPGAHRPSARTCSHLQLRSVILLNCGAGSKLKALVDPSATLPASGCIYVIDANRPFNHNNLRDTESVRAGVCMCAQ